MLIIRPTENDHLYSHVTSLTAAAFMTASTVSHSVGLRAARNVVRVGLLHQLNKELIGLYPKQCRPRVAR